mgnify:FL=1
MTSEHQQIISHLKTQVFDLDMFKSDAVKRCVKIAKCIKVQESQLSKEKAKEKWMGGFVGCVEQDCQEKKEEVFEAIKEIISRRTDFVSKPYDYIDIYGKPDKEQIIISFSKKIMALPLDERTRFLIKKMKELWENSKHDVEQSEGQVESFQVKMDYWRGAMAFDVERMRDAHDRLNCIQAESLEQMMDLCRDGIKWGLQADGRDEKIKAFDGGIDTDSQAKKEKRTADGQEETMLEYSRNIKEGYELRVAVMTCLGNTLLEEE